ncbi:hypothetical protein DPMN_017729 [Dreissena polymorpha]|uniref:Uncharacterized protein n=1 Tax=Dreissena polymorpha TaxID=45954 RepID=A0A9D4S6N1_DREPO|nr:hypothetical protein DPMN_017729 [Dreissena polymorpha]
MDLSKFISNVEQIVEGEKMERCRAVRGTGNFRLTEQFKHHQLFIDLWEMLTEELRERNKQFLCDYGKSHPNVVVSTDGSRTLIKTPSAGKKTLPTKKKTSRAVKNAIRKKKTCKIDVKLLPYL